MAETLSPNSEFLLVTEPPVVLAVDPTAEQTDEDSEPAPADDPVEAPSAGFEETSEYLPPGPGSEEALESSTELPPAEPAADDGAYFEEPVAEALVYEEPDAEAASLNYAWEGTTDAYGQNGGAEPEGVYPLFLGRRPLYKHVDAMPSTEEELENVIGYLRRLQATIQDTKAADEAQSPANLGLSILQARRLSRTGVVPDPFQTGPIHRAVEASPAESAWAAPVDDPIAASLPSEPMPLAAPTAFKRSQVVWLVLTGILCFVTLGLVVYLWTRLGSLPSAVVATRTHVSARTAPVPTPDGKPSEEAMSFANLALEAVQHNDLAQASDLLKKAQQQGAVMPGLYYQAGLLALGQGQAQDGDNWLELSIRGNEKVADCWYLRANTLFFTEGPASAAEAFAEAAYAEPFNPRYYFFQAECLRRHGKTAAALTQFQQALRCRPNSTDTELILFKIGLTKVESNDDLIFKTEIRDRMSQEPVSGDTLLLAAADAIVRGDFSEAAEDLRRAAVAMPPRTFQSRIRDYFFQAQAGQPDIASVLKVALPTASTGQISPHSGRILIDPATRNLAEADPAGW